MIDQHAGSRRAALSSLGGFALAFALERAARERRRPRPRRLPGSMPTAGRSAGRCLLRAAGASRSMATRSSTRRWRVARRSWSATRPAAGAGVPVIVVNDVRARLCPAAARRVRAAAEQSRSRSPAPTARPRSPRSCARSGSLPASRRPASARSGVETAAGLVEGSLTTPDPLTLHRDLGALKAQGIDHVALEASSHGLDQRRLDGMRFEAVAFTNLSRDHLDYHADMDELSRRQAAAVHRPARSMAARRWSTSTIPSMRPSVRRARTRGAHAADGRARGRLFRDRRHRATKAMASASSVRHDRRADQLPPAADRSVPGQQCARRGGARHRRPASSQGAGARGARDAARAPRGGSNSSGEHNGAAIFVDYSHKPGALRIALDVAAALCQGRARRGLRLRRRSRQGQAADHGRGRDARWPTA